MSDAALSNAAQARRLTPCTRKTPVVGDRFNRLIFLSAVGVTDNREQIGKFRCDCGNDVDVKIYKVRNGHTRSCGCLMRDVCAALHTTHGESFRSNETPEYRSWRAMKNRCTLPTHRHYKNYGGRGISVCGEWLRSYEAFLAHVGRKPTPKHTIDRYPNNDGNYEPGNVRWATRKEQLENRRGSARG